MAALVFVRFADEWAAFLPAGSMEPMRAALGLSYVQVSAVLVALPAGGILGNVFTAAADYVSRRLLASLGALAYGAALITFGFAHSLAVLVAAAFCWGAASDAFVHGAEVALADLAGEDDLPRTMAKMNMWAAVGDLLGPATLAAGAAWGFGWRGAFIGLGVGFLGYAAWLASQPLPPPRRHEHAEPHATRFLALLTDPAVIMLALMEGLVGLLDEPLHAFMIAYLARVRGLPLMLASAPVVGVLIGGMAGYGAYERLVGERPAGRTLRITAIAMLVLLPATIFAPWPVATAFGLGFGAALAVFYNTLAAAILSLRPGQAGSVSALVSTIGMAGMGFPALVGLVADAHGLTAGVGLYAVVPVVIVGLAWVWRRE